MTSIENVNISPHLSAAYISGSVVEKPVINRQTQVQPVKKEKQDTFINSYSVLKPNNKFEAKIDRWLVKNSPQLFMNKYLNQNVLENALQANPKISDILINKGLKPAIYMQNIQGKNQEHFLTTYQKARELSSNLPEGEESPLLQAALLHDIGKALIPTPILEKPGKLTDEERNVVDLHAELGAEILKTTNISPAVIQAVGLHHLDYNHPLKINNQMAQILSVSDVYSALKEERPYKPSFDELKVKNIMENDNRLNPKLTKIMFTSTT